MKKIGILRDNFKLRQTPALVNAAGNDSEFYSFTLISHAVGDLKVADILKIGILECKVLSLGKYVREYACLTGEPVPGGRQFEIATNLNPDLARDLIGEDVYLIEQANE